MTVVRTNKDVLNHDSVRKIMAYATNVRHDDRRLFSHYSAFLQIGVKDVNAGEFHVYKDDVFPAIETSIPVYDGWDGIIGNLKLPAFGGSSGNEAVSALVSAALDDLHEHRASYIDPNKERHWCGKGKVSIDPTDEYRTGLYGNLNITLSLQAWVCKL